MLMWRNFESFKLVEKCRHYIEKSKVYSRLVNFTSSATGVESYKGQNVESIKM
jgi:hypothetical protein